MYNVPCTLSYILCCTPEPWTYIYMTDSRVVAQNVRAFALLTIILDNTRPSPALGAKHPRTMTLLQSSVQKCKRAFHNSGRFCPQRNSSVWSVCNGLFARCLSAEISALVVLLALFAFVAGSNRGKVLWSLEAPKDPLITRAKARGMRRSFIRFSLAIRFVCFPRQERWWEKLSFVILTLKTRWLIFWVFSDTFSIECFEEHSSILTFHGTLEQI